MVAATVGTTSSNALDPVRAIGEVCARRGVWLHVDAAMSGTAAAIVLGCQRMQPGVELAGVILNRVGSDGHLKSTAEAIRLGTGLPVLGSLPRDPFRAARRGYYR